MFFETIVMGKTADLAMIQKTIIDTLHKEGKSQKVNSERGGCSQQGYFRKLRRKRLMKKQFCKPKKKSTKKNEKLTENKNLRK